MASVSGPGVNVSYEYDADGRRVKEISGGSVKQYLIDRLLPYGQVVVETNGSGNLIAEYVYGLERVSQERGGVKSYYLADGQGSIRQLTDSVGNVTDTYDYTAFGEALASTGTTVNEFRYVGEQADANSGFYYLRARWMDPGMGRFVSVDPMSGSRNDPLSLHRYLYANASPISSSDPTGKWTLVEAITTVTILNILAATAVSTYATGIAAEAGFAIDWFMLSGRAGYGASGVAGGGGVDLVYDNKSGKVWASIEGEAGLDPLSLFKTTRGSGWSVVGGPIFNMSNPSQLSGVGVGAFWPMSVMHLMPGIGGNSTAWGAMTQFAKQAKGRKGWSIGFGVSGGVYSMVFGPSYRMFSAGVSYNSDFVPLDELGADIRDGLSDVVSKVKSFSGMGRNACDFSKNADAAMSILE